jgi:hypothetical protein
MTTIEGRDQASPDLGSFPVLGFWGVCEDSLSSRMKPPHGTYSIQPRSLTDFDSVESPVRTAAGLIALLRAVHAAELTTWGFSYIAEFAAQRVAPRHNMPVALRTTHWIVYSVPVVKSVID